MSTSASYSPYAFPSLSVGSPPISAPTTVPTSDIDTLLGEGRAMDKVQPTNCFPLTLDESALPSLDDSENVPRMSEDVDCLQPTDVPMAEDPDSLGQPFQQELIPTGDFASPIQSELPQHDSPPSAAAAAAYPIQSSPISLPPQVIRPVPLSGVFDTPPSSVRAQASSELRASSTSSVQSPSLHFATPTLRSGESSLHSESNSPFIVQSHLHDASGVRNQRQSTSGQVSSPVKRRHSPEADVANKRTKSLSKEELDNLRPRGLGTNDTTMASVDHDAARPHPSSSVIQLVPHPHPHPSARRRLPFVPPFDQPLALHQVSNTGLQHQKEPLPDACNQERRSSLSVTQSSSSVASHGLPKAIAAHGFIPADAHTYTAQQRILPPVSQASNRGANHPIPTLPPIATQDASTSSLNSRCEFSMPPIPTQPLNAQNDASMKQLYPMPPSHSTSVITFAHHCSVCNNNTFVASDHCNNCVRAAQTNQSVKPSTQHLYSIDMCSC